MLRLVLRYLRRPKKSHQNEAITTNSRCTQSRVKHFTSCFVANTLLKKFESFFI